MEETSGKSVLPLLCLMRCHCPGLQLLEDTSKGIFYRNLIVSDGSDLTDGKTGQYLIVYEVYQLWVSKIRAKPIHTK